MSSFNRVIVMGNLGQTPDLKQTGNGNAVCNLSVATTFVYKDEKTTEWHRIVVFGKQAENCAKYLEKGRSVLVEGRLQTRKWTDKEGVERYSTEIVAQNVQFVGGRGDGQGKAAAPQQQEPAGGLDDLDIPF